MLLSSTILARLHERIDERIRDTAAREIVIAALGDSVTAGSGADGENLGDDVYHAQLKRLLEQHYSPCPFRVINAGQDGQSAPGGTVQLERDILPQQPDLVLIGYGLNDSAGGKWEGREAFCEALGMLIQKTREGCRADIILLTPNMMPRRDNAKIPDRWRHVTELFIHLQNDGVLSAYAQCVRDVGKANNVPVADVYAAWEALEANGTDTTEMLSNGLNHPDASGHRLAAEVIFRVIKNNER